MTDEELDALVERARYQGPSVTADQLVGLDACIRQLGGQMAMIARPDLAARFGLEPSGTLLIGPPGTGKTLVARYLAGRLDVPLYQFSADEFGDDPETVHALFRRLAGEQALLYIDEVSILAQRREWSSSEDRRMLTALLTELDGLASAAPGGLWVIGACTPDIRLDPALYRSGRLGVVVEFAVPSEAHRRELLDLYLRGVPHAMEAAELDRLAEIATGATGADIRDWVSQAASLVLAEADGPEPLIEYRHLETVVARRGFIAAEDRAGREPDWETAVHESAHAALALARFGRDALAKVSLGFGAPEGGLVAPARGHFAFSDDWLLRHPPTSATWADHACVALAGVVAEERLLGYRGDGATQDVSHATELIYAQLDAADPAFGPSRTTIEAESGVRSATAGSEAMRRMAWELAQRRFAACWADTRTLVAEHRRAIERLATELLAARRMLTGDEIVAIIGEAANA